MHYAPPKRPDPALVSQLVAIANGLSDRGAEGLAAWAEAFIAAHLAAPGGLSIEVGTRVGGSALLFGGLLEAMYGEAMPPPLWTVDPYGGKPYVDGYGGEFPGYGDDVYQAMKYNLRAMPNHAHWMMPSHRFFTSIAGLPFWRPGNRTVPSFTVATGAPSIERMGEEYEAGEDSASFILHDGEHSAAAIVNDLHEGLRWLKPGGGAFVIDNVDSDRATPAAVRVALTEIAASLACVQARTVTFDLAIEPGGRWAVITRR